jgi:hypothetical protein
MKRFHDFGQHERLSEKGGPLELLSALASRRRSRDENDRQARIGGPGASRNVEAVGPGSQINVGDQGGQIGVTIHRCDRGDGATNADGVKSTCLQRLAESEVENGIIIDNQDADGAHVPNPAQGAKRRARTCREAALPARL